MASLGFMSLQIGLYLLNMIDAFRGLSLGGVKNDFTPLHENDAARCDETVGLSLNSRSYRVLQSVQLRTCLQDLTGCSGPQLPPPLLHSLHPNISPALKQEK